MRLRNRTHSERKLNHPSALRNAATTKCPSARPSEGSTRALESTNQMAVPETMIAQDLPASSPTVPHQEENGQRSTFGEHTELPESEPSTSIEHASWGTQHANLQAARDHSCEHLDIRRQFMARIAVTGESLTPKSKRLRLFPVDVKFEGIPLELRDFAQWVGWSVEERGENQKPTKVPVNARSENENASSTNPATWSTYDEAISRLSTSPSLGLGFVLSADDPFVVIDFDHCRDPETGEIDPEVLIWIERFGSYAETSVSGTGIHVWVKASLPSGVLGRRAPGIEVYSASRFLTVTGARLQNSPLTIEARQEALEAFLAVRGLDQVALTGGADFEGEPTPPMSDEEILSKLRNETNCEKFERLWKGELSMHGNDHSRADLALVAKIAFYTQDREQIERLFGLSRLNREKWAERADYRDRTIDRVLGSLEEVYQPAMQSNVRLGNFEENTASTGSKSTEQTKCLQDAWRLRTPTFPLEVFPPDVRRYIEEHAATLSVPPEMVGVPLFAATGALIGNRAALQVNNIWYARPGLFTAVVAPPGSAKTPAIEAGTWPLRKLQEAAVREFKPTEQDFRREKEKYGSKSKEGRGPAPVEPHFRDYYSTNATVESLGPMLERAPGILLLQNELSGLIEGFDQYKGRGNDRQFYLSLWSSTGFKVDRKNSPKIFCPRPVASIVGGIQPDLVHKLHAADGARDGFVERFLPIVPECFPAPYTEGSLSPEIFSGVTNLYDQIDAWPDADQSESQPGIMIPMSAEAKALWVSWYNHNHTVLIPAAEGLAAGFYSKLEAYLARFALILHIMRHPVWHQFPVYPVVSEQTMRDAIKLAEFFRAHIHRLLHLLGGQAPATPMTLPAKIVRYLQEVITEGNEGWVTQSAMVRALQGSGDGTAVTAALEELKAAGAVEKRVRKSATKPATEWRACEL